MNTTKKYKKVLVTLHSTLLTRGTYVPLIPLCAVSARRGFNGALVALTYFTCFEFGGTCGSCRSS